jgi:hypothetical protein
LQVVDDQARQWQVQIQQLLQYMHVHMYCQLEISGNNIGPYISDLNNAFDIIDSLRSTRPFDSCIDRGDIVMLSSVAVHVD